MKRIVVVLALFALMGTLFTLAPSITQAEHLSSGGVVATVSLSVVSLSIATSTQITDYGPLHETTFANVPVGQGKQCAHQ